MKDCDCSVEVRKANEPRESVPGLFQCPVCGGKRKTMVVNVGGRQLTVEHLEDREVKDGQPGVTCPEPLPGTTHTCGLPMGHTGPHVVLAAKDSKEGEELHKAFFSEDIPADVRMERIEGRSTAKAGPCDHPVEGTRCPRCAIGPTAKVCEECQGSGRQVVDVTSFANVREGKPTIHSAPCGTCEGFGWLWSDGVRAKPCVEKQVACGRTEQCASCPHKDVMGWGPSALRSLMMTAPGKVLFLLRPDAWARAVAAGKAAQQGETAFADYVLSNCVSMVVRPEDPLYSQVNHMQVLVSAVFPSPSEVRAAGATHFSIGGTVKGGKPC